MLDTKAVLGIFLDLNQRSLAVPWLKGAALAECRGQQRDRSVRCG